MPSVLFLYDLVRFLIIGMLLCAGTYKIKMILLKVFWWHKNQDLPR